MPALLKLTPTKTKGNRQKRNGARFATFIQSTAIVRNDGREDGMLRGKRSFTIRQEASIKNDTKNELTLRTRYDIRQVGKSWEIFTTYGKLE